MANETTSNTAVLVGRSSVVCSNEYGTMVLLVATGMGLGTHDSEVGEVSRATWGTRTGRSGIASGGDRETEDGIDTGKVFHTNG